MIRLLAAALALLAIACTEESTPQPPTDPELPPPTQVGARAGACLLNDSAWVAGSPALAFPTLAELTNGPAVLSVELYRFIPGEAPVSDLIAIYATGVTGVGVYPLSFVTYPEGDFPGLYYQNVIRGCENLSFAAGTGTLEIYFYDPARNIISGRFSGRIPGTCGEVVIRNGWFDTTYTPTDY
ncbi:MAG: hypothetical protein SFY70_07280 [Bacteroidia bacterium]|nr:hypothetical protein [Bacteroidia bacterium]